MLEQQKKHVGGQAIPLRMIDVVKESSSPCKRVGTF